MYGLYAFMLKVQNTTGRLSMNIPLKVRRMQHSGTVRPSVDVVKKLFDKNVLLIKEGALFI